MYHEHNKQTICSSSYERGLVREWKRERKKGSLNWDSLIKRKSILKGNRDLEMCSTVIKWKRQLKYEREKMCVRNIITLQTKP